MTTATFKFVLAFLFASGSAFNFNKIGFQDPVKNEKRMVGGSLVEKGEADFVVAIFSNRDMQIISQGCLYKEIYVLTTQMPLIGLSPNELIVFFGNSLIAPLARAMVTDIYRHPYFNLSTHSHDIAILKIKSSGIPREVYAKNVTLFNGGLTEGAELKMFGWGTTSSGGSISYRLQKVQTFSISRRDCRDQYSEVFDKTMLCTFNKGKSACQLDEGAPLVLYQSLNTPHPTLVGLNSFGRCGTSSLPDLHAKIRYLKSWIEGEIN